MDKVLIHLHPDFSEQLEKIIDTWNHKQQAKLFIGIRLTRKYEVKLLTKGAIEAEHLIRMANRIRSESGFSSNDEIIIFTEKRIFTDEYDQLFLLGSTRWDNPPNVTVISLDFIRKLFHTNKPYMFRAILVNILSALAQNEGFLTHEETRGCVLDFCDYMPDIIRAIDKGPTFCPEHEAQIRDANKEYLLRLVDAILDKDLAKQDEIVTKKISSLEKARLQEGENQFDYDVALSFAGEDRKYAKQLAKILTEKGVKVFYDEFEKHGLWGKDLYTYLYDLYKLRAKYCIIFISKYYAQKMWTNHERKAAQERAIKEHREYILPIKLDDTEIPGIPQTIGYISWFDETPEKIVEYLLKKLEQTQ